MKGREHWGTRLGLILAMAGNAVGFGNFLRFPGEAAANGGGAFMIPYVVALVLLGIPVMWVEWAAGPLRGYPGPRHLAGHVRIDIAQPGSEIRGAFGHCPAFLGSALLHIRGILDLGLLIFLGQGHLCHIHGARTV